jgi:hypothetical protein
MMPISLKSTYIVSGQISNLTDPLGKSKSIPEGLIVRAYEMTTPKEPVLLGETATNADGLYQITAVKKLFGTNGDLDVSIRVYDGDNLLGASEPPRRTLKHQAKINLQVKMPDVITPAVNYLVEGKVASPLKFKTGKLRVEIVDKNVKEDLILATTFTDAAGAYQARFTDIELSKTGKDQLDIQARVYADQKPLAASEIHYNASTHETIDIQLEQKVIDDSISDLPSDYETLTSTLSEHFSGKLGEIEENDDRQDITYLANKTGWDARAVAQASLAERRSAEANSEGSGGIKPDFFYALFEAGVPADPNLLYKVDAGTVEAVWKKAIAQGVLSKALETELPGAITQFKQLAKKQILNAPALTGISSLKEMLSFSLGPDVAKHEQFVELYTQYAEDPPGFWGKVKKALPAEADRLQLDGQLAYLTLNNVSLMDKVHTKIKAGVDPKGMSHAEQLVQGGLYQAKAWELLMGDSPIPPEVTGKDASEKKSNYASLLAEQVRFSFPTAVVAQMVKNKETVLLDKKGKKGELISDEMVNKIHAFLSSEQREFNIGLQPVEQYVKGKKLTVEPGVIQEITRIQRVYQITPNDPEARNALLKKGLDSAYAIAHYDRESFIRAFKNEVGFKNEVDSEAKAEVKARQIHARAEHVHNAVLNVAISYLTASRAPGIGVHSPGQYVNPAPTGPNANTSDVIAYPTLESLLGEMDFCTCEHCRSILSPAAYLVDLLSFLDRGEEEWAKVREDWENDHTDAPYPYTKDEWDIARHPAGVEETPLQVLLSRRPDIQHLQLTCENTNIPLPYIDLVNEVLEYYVANDLSLENYTGHTTDSDARPEELLADPQFVSDRAYETLAGLAKSNGTLPLLSPKSSLPFNQPLEYLRRYFDKFDTPLPDVMEALRKDENLERANPNAYGWRDILMEELSLSRAEYNLLTQRNKDKRGTTDVSLTVKTLYGFGPAVRERELRQTLSNAKSFCRIVGITYEELIEILQTRFCNPNSALVSRLEKLGYTYLFPKLEKLGINFVDIQNLKEGTLSVADFNAKLPADLDKSPYDGDVAQWVKDNFEQIVNNLGINFQIIRDLKENNLTDSAFKALLPLDEIDITRFGGQAGQSEDEKFVSIKKWILGRYDQIMALILLTDPTGINEISSFDKLEMRYAEPDEKRNPLRPFEFVRLIRFIRLWRKLGWTIEQTDQAILALYPASQAPNDADDAVNLQKLDDGFLVLLPRLGTLRRVIKSLKLKPKKDLQALLACFAPIDTHNGSMSLYQQIFPYALRKQAPAFEDNGYGEFLTDNTQKLDAYVEVLRAAFGLTGDEYSMILAAPGFNDRFVSVPYSHPLPTLEPGILAKAPGIAYNHVTQQLTFMGILDAATRDALKTVNGVSDTFKTAIDELYGACQFLTLEKVSAIFRRGWLARTLKLSVPEFLLLSRFTGIDPFSPLDPPDLPILQFIKLVDRLRALSVKPAQALYLIWNQDLSGSSAPDEREVTDFTRTIRSDLNTIEREFVPVPDPDGQIARARMTLVYGNEAADLFFGLLGKSVITEVEYTHEEDVLKQSVLDVTDKLSYDKFRKQLSFKAGAMPDSVLAALKAVAGTTDDFKNAIDELYKKSRNFFERYPELLPLHDAYLNSLEPGERKRSNLLASILPELKRRRKHQQVLQATSAALTTSMEFTSALLDTKLADKYVLHAAADSTRSALEDITALETAGLSAHIFLGDKIPDPVPAPQPFIRNAEAKLDYDANGIKGLIENRDGSITGIWSGYLEVPENGFYNLLIDVDAAAKVKLNLDGTERADLQQNGSTWANLAPIELFAGILYPISIKIENVREKLKVRWERSGHGREIIPEEYLYSDILVNHLSQTYIRFQKAASLAGGLKLTPAETVYLASLPDYQIDGQGWLNSLPVNGNPDHANATKLLKAFTALLDYARIKAELAPGDERLLTILQDPAAKTPNSDSLLLALTRWDASSLDSLLVHFGNVKDTQADRDALKDLWTFCRIYDAFGWVKKLGIPASALIKATTNEPDAVIVRDFQAALRARYNKSDWLDILRPINDELRSLQRDALVAYILHQMQQDKDARHIDTPDKLFEYFLMDVQMEPCTQTSRIRHAISTVQLFIDRCLMNLERRVAPSVINAKHWEWMNRYRVWEANRKVFLYPENWLEPELRDDQSPFFKETMSELLQGDITEDSAATAMLNYLSKLEEVAKLEPCGIHYIKDDPETDAQEEIAHVVARTAGGNRKYYYRRCEFGSWTPWEQIKLDIEDNPVIPVVWQGRLFLFWLRILTQNAPLIDIDKAQFPTVIVQLVLCWSEYYNGKWQTTKTSDVTKPLELSAPSSLIGENKFSLDGENKFDRSCLHLGVVQTGNGPLSIIVYGGTAEQSYGRNYFILYNTHSRPEFSMYPIGIYYRDVRTLSLSDSLFSIEYMFPQGLEATNVNFTRFILEPKSGPHSGMLASVVKPEHSIQSYLDGWQAPFFYEDGKHVFYVSTVAKDVIIPDGNAYSH